MAAKTASFIQVPLPPLSPLEVTKIAYEATVRWAQAYELKRQAEIVKGRGLGAKQADALAKILFTQEDYFMRAWSSSLDSSSGVLYQDISAALASHRFTVKNEITGVLYPWQSQVVDKLIDDYACRGLKPSVLDYKKLHAPEAHVAPPDLLPESRKITLDKYLYVPSQSRHLLIEEKAGGDLDKTKAQVEKRKLLIGYAILYNLFPKDSITVHLATAYDKDMHKPEWKQAQVLKVFHRDELLIADQWWKSLVGSPMGYVAVRAGLKMAAPYTQGLRSRLQGLYDACLVPAVAQAYRRKVLPLYPLPLPPFPIAKIIPPPVLTPPKVATVKKLKAR